MNQLQQDQKAQPPAPRPAFFRRGDVWVVLGLLAAGGLWLAFTLMQPAGAKATISVTQLDGTTQTQTVRLGKDQMIHVEGTPFPVTLKVEDGAISFVDAQCPDHLCEEFGALSHEGEWALCAPAGVMVRISESQ